jgi:hypothetical protein
MLLGIVRSTSIPNNIHITLVMLAHAFLAVICAQSRKTTGIDVSPANIPSSGQVVDASPPLPAPDMPPLISAPKSPPSLLALPAAETFTSSPLQAHSTTPLASPKLSSTLSSIGASPPLPIPKGSSILPQIEGSPSLPIPDTPPQLPAPSVLPSPARYCPAPLTIPEVRHLLGSLIWPTSTNTKLVLAWSWWRRCHRGMASYHHTRARLKAG